MAKFIHEVSKNVSLEALERAMNTLNPKTTQYYQDLAIMPNINTLSKFAFLKYK